MRRRKAIKILLIAGGGGVLLGGYQWFGIKKHPDLDYLDNNKTLLAALAETIIPKTDTPGAREAGVGDFIIVMLKDCTSRETQNRFIAGLKDLTAYCSGRYQKNYMQLSPDEQHEVLAYFQRSDKPYQGMMGKAERKYLGSPFYTTLRDYTIMGYCTSETGATQTLAYVAVPGRYNGCIPMEPKQRSWATH